ncbi:MAG TPA: adenylosuccinate lyase [Candidatus Cloacimonetes bacterium]|nr:adenylosuccinate lyase [Candidatus Cloacimonadota bacterium]HEX37666.1 adenylosuccinate lyase [Candidatus Cloacimonadota bacterium]
MITRYTTKEMADLWSLENKFKKWLEIEIAAVEIMNELGLVPDIDLKNIQEKAKFSVTEIDEIEKKVHHDVIAFLTNVGQNVGPSSRYIHLGMTSSDIIDTANSLLMKEAAELLLKVMRELSVILMDRAFQYKNTICMGRSHGIHAEPTTFGLKFALWYDEMQRNIKRMERARDSISVGQISGAVGNYAHLSTDVEKYVCKKLGLKPVNIATQVIQRDRYAEYVSTIAIVGSTLEKIALEIRHLQRTEVHEVEEGFASRQKGSSAMPHKKNPIIAERMCGLARILRSNAQTAFENNALWHERDISHSSVERIILPDSTTLLHYMLVKSKELIKNLVVFPEKMKENMDITHGLIFSQTVLLTLADKGLSREDAYDIVQKAAMECWETGKKFKIILKRTKEITSILDEEEIEALFQMEKFTKNVDTIFSRVFHAKE